VGAMRGYRVPAPEYSQDYFGAFVFDLDGNKIEAVVSIR
jgi:hypothetical protein